MKRDAPPDTVRVAADLAREFTLQALTASGTDAWAAEATADGLWRASLRGTDSHGIRLLPHYLKAVGAGRINPHPQMTFTRTSPSTGRLDADHGFGHAAGVRAIDQAIALAGEAGTGFVSVQNSNHCGAMAYFGLRPCAHNMIGLAFTHASPKVLSPGSTGSLFGINPICVCAPMKGEAPFVYDSAPTAITANRLKMYAETGVPLPPGVAADAAGNPTTDADKALQLVPIGSHKGFGLAVVVDIVCALLSGMPAGPNVSMMYTDPIFKKRLLGQFYGAIRIDVFEDPPVFKARLKGLCDAIRAQPVRGDAEEPPMAPGDPEKHAESDRLRNGIPMLPRLVDDLDACAAVLGVESLAARL
jgi:ureidoglycolate dehydrogenase (NAD+)